MGLTLDVLPVNLHAFYVRALGGAEVVDVGRAVREQRSVNLAELALMRETAAIMTGALAELPSYLRAGMTEPRAHRGGGVPLAATWQRGQPSAARLQPGAVRGAGAGWRERDGPGFFDGPVTGRGLSAAAPLGASRDAVSRDVPILLDYTAVKNGYVVDMTRMAVVGRLDPELERAFEVALAIQAEVAGRLRPGEIPSAIWDRARAIAEEAGLGGHFMARLATRRASSDMESASSSTSCRCSRRASTSRSSPGQTVAVEPKFVLPGKGAIGIENTWAVGERGGEKITVLADDLVRMA